MIGITTSLEILGVIGAVSLVILAIGLSYRLFRQRELEKRMALKRYRTALDKYVRNPESKEAQDLCFEMGDEYFKFMIPDVYNYPVYDFSFYLNFIDNSAERHEMISNEMSDLLEKFHNEVASDDSDKSDENLQKKVA